MQPMFAAEIKLLISSLSQVFLTQQQVVIREEKQLARSQDSVVEKYMKARKRLN